MTSQQPDGNGQNKRFTVALVHFPCVDRTGAHYATSVTNLDVHDISRSCVTYGVDQYYIVHPVWAQREMANTIAQFWQTGKGKERNPDRHQALSIARVAETIAHVRERETEICGTPPLVVSTTAKETMGSWSIEKTRQVIEEEHVLMLLGTGHGLANEVLEESDAVMAPIHGPTAYNHLSVRSAAAIILDRLRGRPSL